MTHNPAEQTLEKRLERELRQQKTEALQFKNPQPIGADVLAVDRLPNNGPVLVGPLNLGAGHSGNFNITITPGLEILTLWNMLYTVTVDGIDPSLDRFPDGANMTTGKRFMTHTNWIDWVTSSDTTNVRLYKIRVYNDDTDPHSYYIFFRAYLPRLGGSGT